MIKQRRALILYATMTKNTEKIARWFQETFEEYKWEVTSIRLKNTMDVDAVQPRVYFDDYDVVCLGSPIVAGYPFFVKWDSGEDITDPTFNGVFIEEAQDPLFPINIDYTIYTIGYYSADMLQPESALAEDEPLIYYLSSDNKLRFTGTPRLMGAFRHGFVFRKTETGALDFTLDFDGDEVTGITEVDGGKVQTAPEVFYNLQGVKLSAQPKQKGVYIQNGKKVIIK